MTDRDELMEARLADHFAREVRRAERDVAAGRLGRTGLVSTRSRPASLPIGLAALVVTVVVALTAIGLNAGWWSASSSGSPAVPPSAVPSAPATAANRTTNPTTSSSAVDARYLDGIPSRLGGAPVLRPAAANALAQSATDDSSFLVGGWSRGKVAYSCPMIPAGQVQPPLVPRCGDFILDDGPVAGPTVAESIIVGIDVSLALQPGPVVLRVHARDARAGQCPPDQRTACLGALVAEAVAWAGDASTASAPLSVQDVGLRLQQVDPNLDLAAVDTTGQESPACVLPWPRFNAWVPKDRGPSDSGRIERVLVFRTVAALRAAQDARLRLLCLVGGPVELVQDNVVVQVVAPQSGNTAADVEQIRSALELPILAPRY